MRYEASLWVCPRGQGFAPNTEMAEVSSSHTDVVNALGQSTGPRMVESDARQYLVVAPNGGFPYKRLRTG